MTELKRLQRENAKLRSDRDEMLIRASGIALDLVSLRHEYGLLEAKLAAAEAALLDIYKTAKEACANPRHLTTDVACSRLTYIIGFCERTGLRPEVIDTAKTEVTPDTCLRFITRSWCLTCKRKVVTFGNICCKCGNDPKKEAAKTEVKA